MTDVIENLLIDFDEMGFVPTTTVPNPDKYACEWKKKLVAEINCLQAQLEAAIAGQKTLQKALTEKDREVAELNSDLKLLRNDYDCLKEKFDKAIEKNISLRDKFLRLTAEQNSAKATRAEAIREFAERLKDDWWHNAYYSEDVNVRDWIDKLLKEMAGEK